METTENVIVAFEAPKYLLAHPDARIEYGQLGNAHGGYDPVVRFVFLKGCKGRVIVATGSTFVPIDFAGRRIPIAQRNNVYVFPTLGLGLIASRASRVMDRMMMAGAHASGENSPALSDSSRIASFT
jgi:Malic enzyme, NAD binding domain